MRSVAMSEYHEPTEELDDATRDAHRAITSLKEELEAADWYHQRLARCTDAELGKILEHNRNEEFEHAAMLIEWLRRKRPEFHERLAKIAFTDRPLGVELDGPAPGPSERESKRHEPREASNGRGLGVGSLRGGGA
jgi:ferritin-like protein